VSDWFAALRRELSDVAVASAAIGFVALFLFALSPLGERLDGEITVSVSRAAGTEWDSALRVLEIVGQRGPLTVIVVALGIAAAVRLRRWGPLLLAVATPIAFTLTIGGLKVILGRNFPHEPVADWWDGGLAFPSGHAAGAVVFWGIAALLTAELMGREPRLRLAWLWGPWAVVAACSILRGTHWASDLIAGGLVGFLVLRGLLASRSALVLASANSGSARVSGIVGAHTRAPSGSLNAHHVLGFDNDSSR